MKWGDKEFDPSKTNWAKLRQKRIENLEKTGYPVRYDPFGEPYIEDGLSLGWALVALSKMITGGVMTKDEFLEYWTSELSRKLQLCGWTPSPEAVMDRSPIKETLEKVYDVGVEAGRDAEKLKGQLENE